MILTKNFTIMKTRILIMLFSMSLAMLFGTESCTKDNTDAGGTGNLISVSADGTTLLLQNMTGSVLTNNLSFNNDELEMLLHMKEEEKLARDVYKSLYEKWGIQIFLNISNAEETHLNAVIFLLQNYGEEHTSIGEPGIFSNPVFQELYAELISKGSESLQAALETGALIEEMDIKDLEEYLQIITNENIVMVFENLQKGSRNHLRAFNKQLINLGISYTPVYITREEYDQIVNSPIENGGNSQKQGNRRKGNQNRNGRWS